jgi:Lipid A 3-O-deacylase (PagL)
MRHRGCGFQSTPRFAGRGAGGHRGVALLCSIGALFFASPPAAFAQDAKPAEEILATPLVTTTRAPAKPPAASEITVEGMASYGHWIIFASGRNCKLYDAGMEYDRHAWGRFLKARVDYVAEFLPMVLLNQPANTDIWGNYYGSARKIVPGVDISPVGIRWLWRDGRAIKPYLVTKVGVIAFTQKALSSRATYESFSLRSTGGIQVRLNDRFDLRLGLFGYMHFSNGFIVPVNPGLDVMNASVGLTYHLGSKRRIAVH